jgi:hypothetical protein
MGTMSESHSSDNQELVKKDLEALAREGLPFVKANHLKVLPTLPVFGGTLENPVSLQVFQLHFARFLPSLTVVDPVMAEMACRLFGATEDTRKKDRSGREDAVGAVRYEEKVVGGDAVRRRPNGRKWLILDFVTKALTEPDLLSLMATPTGPPVAALGYSEEIPQPTNLVIREVSLDVRLDTDSDGRRVNTCSFLFEANQSEAHRFVCVHAIHGRAPARPQVALAAGDPGNGLRMQLAPTRVGVRWFCIFDLGVLSQGETRELVYREVLLESHRCDFLWPPPGGADKVIFNLSSEGRPFEWVRSVLAYGDNYKQSLYENLPIIKNAARLEWQHDPEKAPEIPGLWWTFGFDYNIKIIDKMT